MGQKAEQVETNGIRTWVIDGRHYVDVSQRIELFTRLGIEDVVVSDESGPREFQGFFYWKVVVLINGRRWEGNSDILFNAKLSSADARAPFANAETSAWGRLLGFFGLGTPGSIASFEEISRNWTEEIPTVPASTPTSSDDQGKPVRVPSTRTLFLDGKSLGLWADKEGFKKYIKELFKMPDLPDDDYVPSIEQCLQLEKSILKPTSGKEEHK